MLKTTIQITGLLLIGFLYSSCIGYSVKTISYPTTEFLYQKREHPVKGWKNIEIFDEGELDVPYKEVATIVITGNQSASDEKLFRKMKRLAGKYDADAIIFIEGREVDRVYLNGFSAAFEIISAFDGDCYDESETDAIGNYYTVEYEGLAIKFHQEVDALD